MHSVTSNAVAKLFGSIEVFQNASFVGSHTALKTGFYNIQMRSVTSNSGVDGIKVNDIDIGYIRNQNTNGATLYGVISLFIKKGDVITMERNISSNSAFRINSIIPISIDSNT